MAEAVRSAGGLPDRNCSQGRVVPDSGVWPVNGSMIKGKLCRWLRLDRPTEESGEPYPPGYCHFPKYSEEYFKQLTTEQLVTRIVKGYRRPECQKTSDRNEAIDARCHARSAAAVCGMDRFTDAVLSDW